MNCSDDNDRKRPARDSLDDDASNNPGSSDNTESRKRIRRTEREERISSSSLDNINDDCVLRILSFVPDFEDLNSFAMTSRRGRDVRSHESLVQTRSGTIVFAASSTADTLFRAIRQGEWNAVFTGHRTHLKIVGIEKFRGGNDELEGILPGVTSLEMCSSSSTAPAVNHGSDCMELPSICPNVTALNLTFMNITSPMFYAPSTSIFNKIRTLLPRLTKLTWNQCQVDKNHICGPNIKSLEHLVELHMNDSLFVTTATGSDRAVYVYGDPESSTFLFEWPIRINERLARVSIKSATWLEYRNPRADGEEEIPQEVLVKFVRNCPSLRWFRSDLTDTNIAMLKNERPEVTFVND